MADRPIDIRTPDQRAKDAEKREEYEEERRALVKNYALTFNNEIGQRVLKDLERYGFLYTTTLQTPVPEQPIDAAQTWANEGRRQVIIYIRAMLEEAEKGE